MSESGRPGCEFVRCSHPTFFKRVQIYDGYGRLDGVKLESSVKKAIAEDSPSQLMMPLSVAGKSVDTRLLPILLHFRKKRILEWLIENDGKTRKFFGPREMLFYVCAHWFGDETVEWLEKAEKKEPGILKSCIDPLGCNLLWYSNSKEVAEALIKHGCDPDAETVWGLSWRDRSEYENRKSRQVFDVTVNGKTLAEIAAAIRNRNLGFYSDRENNLGVLVDAVRIVMPENGRTFEWKHSGRYDWLELQDISLDADLISSFSMQLRVQRSLDIFPASVCFVLEPDGIVRARTSL